MWPFSLGKKVVSIGTFLVWDVNVVQIECLGYKHAAISYAPPSKTFHIQFQLSIYSSFIVQMEKLAISKIGKSKLRSDV